MGRRASHYRIWESEEIPATFSFTADKIQNFDSFTCVASWFVTWVWHEMWGKTLSTISIYKDFLFLPQKLLCEEGLIWDFFVCAIEFPQQGHWYPFKWASIRKKEDLIETGVVPNHNVARSICLQIRISNIGLFLRLFRKLYVLNNRSYIERNNMIVMNRGLEVSLSWPVSIQIILLSNKSWRK